MSQVPGAPSDAGTVPVRVQVIDLEPFAIDIVVPTYLPASDLTQRVARDAGLGAYWDDGTRRAFWLRARGRVMQDHEKLEDLGVVPGELLHLLPQPPAGSGVHERPPEYPENKGYAAAGTLNLISGLVVVGLWTTGWALGLLYAHNLAVGAFPAAGLSLLSVSFVRHLLGGEGSDVKVPAVGLAVFLPLMGLAYAPALFFGDIAGEDLTFSAILAFAAGLACVVIGWLAWYGAVEKLPERTTAQAVQEQAEAIYNCGICGLAVEPTVRAPCQFNCGQVFHVGCYQARQALHQGTGCAICGFQPG
ncbi:MAG: hypothetical protein EP330_07730 [Deltaproteobacteria bacterium]|nr:MAG: hypothetical protein EP330_07730 [Deltaproteobacteria bacterium]